MSLPFWSIIVAAGAGRRFRGDRPKQYTPLGGKALLLHSLETFARHADDQRLILVVPTGDEDEVRSLLGEDMTGVRVVAGGKTRQESVRRGLEAISDEDAWVAVHDAARPFFDGKFLEPWRERLEELGEKAALVPVLFVADTVFTVEGGAVQARLDRERTARAQTPQLFRLPLLRRAHLEAEHRGESNASDDSSLILALGEKLGTVTGDPGNYKITSAEDLERAERELCWDRPSGTRMGFGYDSHRFDRERPLILGGVTVPSEVGGLAGHSDADVLTHAVMDALLGGAALGDIGQHFPDTDPRWAGASSLDLLARVLALVAERNLRPVHVDATLIAEKPRLADYIPAIREKLAAALELDLDSVSVKATSNEGMGAIGRGEGMAAMAVVSLKETE